MKSSKTQNNLNVVRSQVKTLLARSEAFHSLPPETRRQIAHDTVKIANHLIANASSGTGKPIKDVDFPDFVSSLLNGVFDAIVDSSIKQMEAYAKLVAGVAKALDEFSSEKITDNEARHHLRERLPHFFQSDTKTKRPRMRLASSRQQLLATMVLMGINRIVVTDGRISAKIDWQPAKGR